MSQQAPSCTLLQPAPHPASPAQSSVPPNCKHELLVPCVQSSCTHLNSAMASVSLAPSPMSDMAMRPAAAQPHVQQFRCSCLCLVATLHLLSWSLRVLTSCHQTFTVAWTRSSPCTLPHVTTAAHAGTWMATKAQGGTSQHSLTRTTTLTAHAAGATRCSAARRHSRMDMARCGGWGQLNFKLCAMRSVTICWPAADPQYALSCLVDSKCTDHQSMRHAHLDNFGFV